MIISIRRALVFAFGAIVVGITIVLLGLSAIQRDRLVRDLAPQVLDGTQLHANAEMRHLFAPIDDRLAAHHRQIEAGLLPRYDTSRLKDLFLPGVYHLPSVGSMMLGDTTGYQLLVMRYDSLVTRSPLLADRRGLPAPSLRTPQYFTREFRAAQWGERSVWTLWDASGMHVQADWEQEMPGYDPRKREWLLRALARRAAVDSAGGSVDPEKYVAWTDVYTLFTSKTPGISASIAAREPSGELVVVAYDVLLDDLSAFTRSQRPTQHGQVFVLSDSGLVIGLPASDAWSDESARRAAQLQPLDQVGGSVLAEWMKRWRDHSAESGAPFRFRVGGDSYWGSCERFALDSEQGFWVGVSIPENDLLETTRHDPLIILLLTLLALLVAITAAIAISGQIANPLVALLERSRRIGALQLEHEPSPATALREVRDLSQTIEQTGAALREHLAARERAQAAVIESEERFRSTFEQAAVGMCHVSIDGRFIRVNQRLCDIVGRSRETLLESRFPDITHPDHLDDDRRRIGEFVEGKVDAGSWEKRYVLPSGAAVWSQLTLRLLRDTAGEPRYFIGVIQDISERRNLEEQFRQVQKLEAVGQLAGGVAHDFNNLLTVVKGHAMLARATVPPDHDLLLHLDEIDYAAQRAADLTRQLLSFARRDIVEPKVLAIGALVLRSQMMLQRLIDERIELTTEAIDRACRARIDAGQLEQVLVNLVVNARDAMPDGGRVTISVGEVALSTEEAGRFPDGVSGPHVEIKVTDTGTGMSAEVQSHLFEPFFTTKPPGKGTGLGMSTCYGIVRQAGGQIRVESEPGQGTTFRILLPAVSDRAAIDPTGAGRESAPRGQETILIAEDEPAIRAINERVLREAGYDVHAASDGQAALTLGESLGTALRLVVTDAVMPGLNGHELVERLRARQPRLKVLFVSGYAPESLRGELPDGLHFLAKPYGPEDLVRRVREVLDDGE